MTEYRAPVKDALFTLRHVGMLDELAKTERFSHADLETAESVLEEYGRFLQEVFGPTNAIGDRQGLQWSPEGVSLPDELKRAYAKFVEAGWQGLNGEIEYGGAGFPEAVFTLGAEFMIGANGALSMAPGLVPGCTADAVWRTCSISAALGSPVTGRLRSRSYWRIASRVRVSARPVTETE